jgi:hypothetical protein
VRTKIYRWGVALAAAALAGCATSSAPSGPRPPIARAAALEARASAFESFMRRAGAIDPGFAGPAEVASALQVGAAHDPQQLQAGMIAYAALAALQEPRFVEGVRRTARGDLARRIAANPELALALPGADAAAARAAGALARRGEALSSEGRKVKQAAYTLQKQAWSKQKAPNASARLARVKAISQAGYRPESGDPAHLRRAVAEGGRRSGAASPVVVRGVALAALSVLGEDSRGRAMLSEPKSGLCLRIAKLNLYQCLASAGPYYEDVYCLGTHAMLEPAACVSDAAKPPKAGMQRASYRR